MISRLKEYIDYKGISVSSFEQRIGASDGMIRRAISKNTDIQSKWLSRISDNYHDLNLKWLITGKGDMLVMDKIHTYKDEQNKEFHAQPSEKGIPLIPLDAIAGFGNSESTTVMEYECEKYVIPNFRGAEFLIQVKGSSMYPKYSSGDIVACKKLPLDTFFQWNKVYVLDTEQGVLIKRIKPLEDKDYILCVSDNEKYDPFELHKKNILSVSIVIGVIRLE